RATTSAPALPSTVAGEVAAVLGLTDLAHERPGAIRRPASTRRTFPAARAASFPHPAGSPTRVPTPRSRRSRTGGLTDDQIGNAYGAFGLYRKGDLGAGQRIAIYELEPFARSDLKTFDTCQVEPPTATTAACAPPPSALPAPPAPPGARPGDRGA